MRYCILIFLIVTNLTVYSGEYPTPTFLLKQSGKCESLSVFDNGKIVTNKLTVGETFVRKDTQSEYVTETNSFLSLILASDLIVNIDENSEFKVHFSTVDILNHGSLPTKSVFTNKNHVTSLSSGSIDVINLTTNGSVLLQTPRVSMTLNRGKFRVIVQGKTTLVVCLEGSVILQKLAESKTVVVPESKFAHVTTYYSLTSKGTDVLNNGKPTATIKPIESDDLKKMGESFSELLKLSETVMFVEIDNKTIGVKIR